MSMAVSVQPMLEVDQALETVLDRTKARSPIQAVLAPTLLGRVLAESIASDIDSPPFTKSLMDGYAVRSADATDPVTLTVIEEIAAGKFPTRAIATGQASRVMTGGADSSRGRRGDSARTNIVGRGSGDASARRETGSVRVGTWPRDGIRAGCTFGRIADHATSARIIGERWSQFGERFFQPDSGRHLNGR